MVLEVARKRFTVAEFERMAEAGVLAQDSRLELLQGEIIEMNPIHPRHAACVLRLTRLFGRLGDTAALSVQNPLVLDEHGEPQPDMLLLRPPLERYAATHPRPADVLLLVEVADTTFRYDSTVKVPLYARAGVREVWLVDLAGGRLLVYRDPAADGYRVVETLDRGDVVAPEAFPGFRVLAADVLG